MLSPSRYSSYLRQKRTIVYECYRLIMKGRSFSSHKAKERAEVPRESNQSSIVQIRSNLLTSKMARFTRLTRDDTTHAFIVYKTESAEGSSQLLEDRGAKRQASQLRRNTRDEKYDFDIESVLAFGGMRRGGKPRRTLQGSNVVAKVESTSTQRNGSSSSESTASSTATTLQDDLEGSPEWMAFRAKYAKRHESDESNHFGRYRAGRGYVEYRHRHDCDGSCQGVCLGK